MHTRSLAPLALLLPGVATAANPNAAGFFVAQFGHVLGTSLTVKLVAPSLAIARQTERAVLAEITRLESVLSSYRPHSEFRRWLTAPVGQAVTVSDDLFAVLSQFDHWRVQTNGAISAAAEHLLQGWHRAAQTGETPSETDRHQAVADVNQTHWQLDADHQTATRLTLVPLRLHTFAKSYVLDRAAEAALNRPGVDGVVLNSGGDIVVRGNWQETIAVANPRADAENAVPIAQIRAQNAAVATSGNYRRGLQIGAEWVSHIMDPRTGLPARDIISATVLHPDAPTAGALATAFNVLTPSESASLATQLPGTEYLLVTRDGYYIPSAGWPGRARPTSEGPFAATSFSPTTAHLLSVPAKDKLWNPSQELLISFELAQIEGRSHRSKGGRTGPLWRSGLRTKPENRYGNWPCGTTNPAGCTTCATGIPSTSNETWRCPLPAPPVRRGSTHSPGMAKTTGVSW